LKRDVNILPICGNHEVRAGNDVSPNVDTVAKVSNSGALSIPPRPSPPEDAFALSSRKYAPSDDELDESADEFNFPETVDPNDDMSTGDAAHAQVVKSLVLAAQRDLGDRTFPRLEPVLRGVLSQELSRLMRSL